LTLVLNSGLVFHRTSGEADGPAVARLNRESMVVNKKVPMASRQIENNDSRKGPGPKPTKVANCREEIIYQFSKKAALLERYERNA